MTAAPQNSDVPPHPPARLITIRGPGATLWGSNAVNGVIKPTYPARQLPPGPK